jgi:hypothetical protein
MGYQGQGWIQGLWKSLFRYVAFKQGFLSDTLLETGTTDNAPRTQSLGERPWCSLGTAFRP